MYWSWSLLLLSLYLSFLSGHLQDRSLKVVFIVFVFVILFVFVFVFVFVFCLFSDRPCLLVTLIKCLKGQNSLGSLFQDVLKMYLSWSLPLSLSLSLSLYFFGRVMSSFHSDQMKGSKSLGSLFEGVL